MPRKKTAVQEPAELKKPSGSSRKRAAGKPPAELAYIAEALRPLAEPVEKLGEDPGNARTHDDANLAAIEYSLRQYGQRKPVVANRRSGQLEAGHGTLVAAGRLGWTHLAVVWVDDDPATASGFALADNRTAELAEWDELRLAALLGDDETSPGLEFVDQLAWSGFLDAQAEKIADETAESDEENVEPPAPDLFEVVVDCRDEADQKDFFERMQKEGRKCRLLTL